jgi:hypothetical protein
LAGVWLLEEDALLKQGDAGRMAELDEKHGYGASIERQRFLATWRSASRQQRR